MYLKFKQKTLYNIQINI